MTIERWDPFGEMLTLRDAMNRLFEESFVRPSPALSTSERMGVPVGLRETGDQYILEASIPGVQPVVGIASMIFGILLLVLPGPGALAPLWPISAHADPAHQ